MRLQRNQYSFFSSFTFLVLFKNKKKCMYSTVIPLSGKPLHWGGLADFTPPNPPIIIALDTRVLHIFSWNPINILSDAIFSAVFIANIWHQRCGCLCTHPSIGIGSTSSEGWLHGAQGGGRFFCGSDLLHFLHQQPVEMGGAGCAEHPDMYLWLELLKSLLRHGVLSVKMHPAECS